MTTLPAPRLRRKPYALHRRPTARQAAQIREVIYLERILSGPFASYELAQAIADYYLTDRNLIQISCMLRMRSPGGFYSRKFVSPDGIETIYC